uniref:ADP,ATP carrier protein n=1 Tax=Hemiselmis tepida TaxID=464990 RepID=A0A6T6X1H5_9CRYP|mmetsp:Transcript_37898/g.96894  ORF Transcript_37898/g.96894 Transcript_37898/m.96894 type:complete len:579 (+) Transcript_37898:129-1865(+)
MTHKTILAVGLVLLATQASALVSKPHLGPAPSSAPRLSAPQASEGLLSQPKRVEGDVQATEGLRLKGGATESAAPARTRLAKLKDALFPIEGWEMAKFFSMSMMMFMIIYIYTTVRDTKDTLVVSTCGAESITFLKVYGVLPAATMFMVYYSWLSSVFSKKWLFYVTAVPFMAFYGLFAWVLYPNRALIHPTLPKDLDERWQYVLLLLSNWSYSLFYIVSELWGSVGVSVLFWQLANEITPVWQAKRFYPLFGQLANIAPICAGQTVAYFAKMSAEGDDAFAKSLQYTTVLILSAGALLMGLYHQVGVLDERDVKEGRKGDDHVPINKKKKAKMSMAESFKFLVQQRYLGYLCILVISYGLSINLTEVIWKRMVKQAYTNKKDYQIFMGNYSSLVGAATFVIIFFGSNIVKHLGWTIGALTTPVLMGGLAAPFFSFVIMNDVKSDKTVLSKAVFVGMWQNILSKAIKYALFDPTKEMAYIPLDHDTKVKGKAAIDVLAARIGKSGGALVQQFIVMYFGNIIDGAGCVATVFFGTIAAWIWGVLGLAKMFEEKVAAGKKASEKAATEKAAKDKAKAKAK